MGLADRLKTRLAEALPGGAPLRLERPLASLCFDDFPRSAWHVGGPILARHGVKASFYPAGSFCGRCAEGADQFTAADLREVRDAGHEIGCHSFSHRPASGMSARAFADDLDRNAAFLRDEAGVAPRTFAYPYGLFSPGSLAVTRPRFAGARRVRGGVNAGIVDTHRIAAFPLEVRSWSAAAFARAVDETVRRRGWLVLFTHDVSEAPTPYGCTPAMLKDTVEGLERSGVEIVSAAAALRPMDKASSG